MKNRDKILMIIGIVCILIIILCITIYISKYYIIYKFQKKIDEIEKIGNYEMISNDYTVYVKNNIYVLVNSDKSYIISDKNTFENYIIKPNEFKNICVVRIRSVSSIFSVKNSDDKTTLLNIKNNLRYSRLRKVNFKGKECYELIFFEKNNSIKTTIYFEKGTYMPVAYNLEGGALNVVKINMGTVTDEDVSPEAIYKKLMELTS